MKKINLTGKLNLKKESIARLNEQQMTAANGGKEFLSLWNCRTDGGSSSPCNPQTCDSPQNTCVYLNGC